MMTRKLDWKQWIKLAFAMLLAADAALLVWNWQLRGSAPEVQARQRDLLRSQHDALGADVRLAGDIRKRLPEVDRQCDRFVKEQLLALAGGYSAVVEDLNKISSQSGLTTRGVQYKQKELAGRGVAEVQISASVEGSYANLVRFINELERSKQFYLLEQLGLAETTAGTAIKLNLQLKTYFRLKS